jgi:hypothetical protein
MITTNANTALYLKAALVVACLLSHPTHPHIRAKYRKKSSNISPRKAIIDRATISEICHPPAVSVCGHVFLANGSISMLSRWFNIGVISRWHENLYHVFAFSDDNDI